ncbi:MULTISPECIES: TetR/AcrR family transcriptional regulator [Mycobacterium]|uniref:TetR family transcriptional regulator n=1 Tax=Mycobacterium gordonae TaxID=1778 RepID=A0A0Q2QCE5_MYCGO|nr:MULTISPECIES: TetR/AcrR family transcriptional regulator [Mycobacterium]KQH77397.1 TetR family transcriptional regulator [Mycobacterium gordonae]MDP7727822.1 TetR/AcrR family transcriptional regulator [Mycobacterium sp. TY813]
MVERILNAAQEVLIAHGYDGASTNRIAAAAGVSPGSLYQYFPNKDAIVAAVIDRYSDELAAAVASTLAQSLDQPAPDHVRSSVAALLDALDVHPEFLRAVIEQTPRLGSSGKLVAFEQRISELTMAYLMLNRRQVRPDVRFDTASWMLVRMVEHLTIRYILDRPDISRDEFLSEITTLALNYLRVQERPVRRV